MPRCTLTYVALFVALGWASPALAVDFFWVGPGLGGPGGNFRNSNNWTFTPPPFPLVPAPGGADDTANFDLGRDPEDRYTVTNVRGENDQLIVHDDSLTLVIPDIAAGADYELLSEDPDFPSLLVGGESDELANVIFMGSVGSMLQTHSTLIADANGSVGVVTVDDLEWVNASGLRVGNAGDATLTIQNGASLSSGGSAIAVGNTSSSTVHVDGAGSIWNIAASPTTGVSLNVGFFGSSNGTLMIENGGSVVAAGNVNVAIQPNSNGAVTVTGDDSTLTVNGTHLTIGSRGNGTMTVENGGSVTSTLGLIGSGAEATGTVTVVGAGSNWEMVRLSVGGDAFFGGGNGGEGTLNVQLGGAVQAFGDITLYPDGRVRLQGGDLTLGMFDFQGGQFQWTSGTLRINMFDGDLTNPIGGTLAPGPAGTGITTITGNYTQQAGATLDIDIAGLAAGMFDTVIVEGNAFLAGAIDVSLVAPFAPSLGDSFTVLETPFGSVSGQFNSVIMPTFNGLTFEVIYNAQNIVLDVVEALPGDYNDDGTVDAADYVVWRKTDNSPSGYNTWRMHFGETIGSGSGAADSANAAVPEPASLAMFVLAAAVAMPRRSRRRVSPIEDSPWRNSQARRRLAFGHHFR